MRLALLALLLVTGGLLHAQNVGDPVTNKIFINSWNTPPGYDELNDYFVAPGHIVLLDWWGAS